MIDPFTYTHVGMESSEGLNLEQRYSNLIEPESFLKGLRRLIKEHPVVTLGMGLILSSYAYLNFAFGYDLTKALLKENKTETQIEDSLHKFYQTQRGGEFFERLTKPGRNVAYFIKDLEQNGR